MPQMINTLGKASTMWPKQHGGNYDDIVLPEMQQKSKSHFVFKPRLETLHATYFTASDSMEASSKMSSSFKGTVQMSNDAVFREEATRLAAIGSSSNQIDTHTSNEKSAPNYGIQAKPMQ